MDVLVKTNHLIPQNIKEFIKAVDNTYRSFGPQNLKLQILSVLLPGILSLSFMAYERDWLL